MNHAERMNACFRACEGIEDEVLEDRQYRIKPELDSIDKIIESSGKIIQQRDTAWQELREIRSRLSALEEISTAVEADIDSGRPLEYNVEELRAELIRARKALGILPEQVDVDCPICNGKGYTEEHCSEANAHDGEGSCLGRCPVQESCFNCEATGKIKDSDEWKKVTWGPAPITAGKVGE